MLLIYLVLMSGSGSGTRTSTTVIVKCAVRIDFVTKAETYKLLDNENAMAEANYHSALSKKLNYM